jgi:hypothetical protein
MEKSTSPVTLSTLPRSFSRDNINKGNQIINFLEPIRLVTSKTGAGDEPLSASKRKGGKSIRRNRNEGEEMEEDEEGEEEEEIDKEENADDDDDDDDNENESENGPDGNEEEDAGEYADAGNRSARNPDKGMLCIVDFRNKNPVPIHHPRGPTFPYQNERGILLVNLLQKLFAVMPSKCFFMFRGRVSYL